jgi:hypothetical protein
VLQQRGDDIGVACGRGGIQGSAAESVAPLDVCAGTQELGDYTRMPVHRSCDERGPIAVQAVRTGAIREQPDNLGHIAPSRRFKKRVIHSQCHSQRRHQQQASPRHCARHNEEGEKEWGGRVGPLFWSGVCLDVVF